MERSNKYILIYSAVMVIIVAISLTVVAVQLRPAQEANIRIEKMQNILATVNIPVDKIDKKEIPALFKKTIVNSFAVNNKGEVIEKNTDKVFAINLVDELQKPADKRRYPVFEAALDAKDTAFIVPLRGKGLWGPIWGYLAFKPDFNTVFGCFFDHKGETPGLGAEISLGWFQKPFENKTIFDEKGNFVSIKVQKAGQPKQNQHDVDAISGGTITSKGVEHMLHDILLDYLPYFKKERKTSFN